MGQTSRKQFQSRACYGVVNVNIFEAAAVKRILQNTDEHAGRPVQSGTFTLSSTACNSFGVRKMGPQMSFPSTKDVKGTFPLENLEMSSTPTSTTGDRREVSKARPSA